MPTRSPTTLRVFNPSLLTALALLAPACLADPTGDELDADPDGAAVSNDVALELDATIDALNEDEVARRYGGDPNVSDPDPTEAALRLDPDQLPDTTELSSALDPLTIAEETPGIWEGVQRVTNYYHVPRYAEAAWASPDSPGCSSTMIGPNLLMTAAHCSADSTIEMAVQGRVYRDRDLGQRLQESFDCSLLFHTFPETDLAIYHCPPVGGALSLGDRFGWVDVEPTDVTQNQFLFSVFSNAIDALGTTTAHHLLTLGMAEVIGVGNAWANPNTPAGSVLVSGDNSVNQNPQVVRSSLWTNSGASGSAQFDTHGRAIVGPLSTGVPDSALRNALGMYDYLVYGWIYERQSSYCPSEPGGTNCSTTNSVHGTYVSSLGLEPTNYEGTWADQDLNYFFDLAEDVSDLDGENARDTYHLRFSSRQQNRLWDLGPTSSIDHDGDGLSFDTYQEASGTWVELARHEQLNLDALSPYSVTIDLDSEVGYYRVCTDGSSLSCSSWFYQSNDTPTSHTLPISTASGAEALVIQGWNARGSIASVTVVDHALLWQWPNGTSEIVANRFDAFDARNVWFEPDGGDRPSIFPDGEGTDVDWAGRLHKTGSASGYDYDLATDALPIASGDNTLCFSHRRDSSVAWSSAYIYLRVQRQDGSYVTGRYVTPGTDWSETCHDFTTSVSTGEALEVRFGIYGYGSHSAAAFVDGVELTLP